MDISFFIPVKLISGENCVLRHARRLTELGRRCLIVTGRSGAKKSGALDDVTTALNGHGLQYLVYDEITENPSLSSCSKGGNIAARFGADFIIGIGGGSALDASKAIAVLATNNITPSSIYDIDWDNKPLPLALVGTTAGTGSELTPVSVLTEDSTRRKRSFSHESCFADIAFCDPKYTYSLPYDYTISTALDALSHSIEGYFAQKANDISDMFAAKAISLIYNALGTLKDTSGNISPNIRERLYYASLYAGITLAHSGVGYCHAMSYFLTENHQFPHGCACAVFLPSYLERGALFNPEKAKRLFSELSIPASELINTILRHSSRKNVILSVTQVEELSKRWADNKNFTNSPGAFKQSDAAELLKKLFCKI